MAQERLKYLRFLVFLVAIAALCGCSHYVKPNPAAPFPYRAYPYDIHFAWETIPSATGLLVRGVLKNRAFTYIGGIELYVSLHDEAGKEVEKEMFFPIPNPIDLGDVRSFAVAFHHPPPPGGTLEFLYHYLTLDGSFDSYWMSFRTDLATGAVLPNPNEQPPSKF